MSVEASAESALFIMSNMTAKFPELGDLLGTSLIFKPSVNANLKKSKLVIIKKLPISYYCTKRKNKKGRRLYIQ